MLIIPIIMALPIFLVVLFIFSADTSTKDNEKIIPHDNFFGDKIKGKKLLLKRTKIKKEIGFLEKMQNQIKKAEDVKVFFNFFQLIFVLEENNPNFRLKTNREQV